MPTTWRRVVDASEPVVHDEGLAVGSEGEAFEFVDDLEPEQRDLIERHLEDEGDHEAARWMRHPR